ncbi:MAG: ExeM/NucH family extracellular endonuclease [Acidobacteria bacterium]|nr:ExeM/NucH family extracellular endonuclease [Acidobacteriota bacterium]
MRTLAPSRPRASAFHPTSWQAPLVVVALFGILALPQQPVQAVTADLFFSEYVEGSGVNKALEIYNGTGGSVDLAAAGYNVQMYFNGSTSAGLTINLSGVVADGDVFVLAQTTAAAAILAQADQTNGAGWFNGDDAVVLRRGATIVDVIGEIGVDPGTEWGTGLASTQDNTLRRLDTVCAGHTTGGAFAPGTEWNGFATDTFDGLGSHFALCDGGAVDDGPSVTATLPADGTLDAPTGTNLTVTFSENVAVGGTAFALTCTVSGAQAFALSGGPLTFTLDPATDFVPGESCTLTVTASEVHDLDAIDPPDTLAADVTVSFSTVDACTLPYTPTYEIQGSGATAAIVGAVSSLGVVVGDYEQPFGSGNLRGFYIQDPAGDGDPATSDGLFVFGGDNNRVGLGDLVRVTGTAGEFQGQTQISASSVAHCGLGHVTPTDVTLPFASPDTAERYEGMLVRLPQTLYVTEHFQLGRFGQVVVSSGDRLRQPTDVLEPGAAAAALQAANDLNQLILDDDTNLQNPDPIAFGRDGLALSADNTLRGGDTTTGAIGVMTFTWAGNNASGNAYRVRPLGALDGYVRFEAGNPRPAAAPEREGSVRVASMNVLNFFNTFGGCTGGVGGAVMDCRGAEDVFELERQTIKTVAAVLGADADVVGLLEIENDGYGPGSAIQHLVDQLNLATAPGTWAFIDADQGTGEVNALGTDAIKVGLLYRPAAVRPVGTTAALNSLAFVNAGDSGPRNRPALAQAFVDLSTGGRVVVAVNHLKSKGSACDVPDAGDGQGECNVVRTTSAGLLAAWLAGDPTHTGDTDALVMGDLNAYGREDPVVALEDAGFTNLAPLFPVPGSFSYVFDGQWGSLDHALAAASLLPQVTAVHHWLINADEPSVLDYNTNFKSAGQQVTLFAADRFRASDHNPLLIDLALTAERCDADADGDVDAADLSAIRAANRQPANGPHDPRDGNGDGTINVADIRYCQGR